MHLKTHKMVLTALLLFGMGLLVGTNLEAVYRRSVREKAIFLYTRVLESSTVEETALKEDLPREVAGMRRTEHLTGDKAEEFIAGYLGTEEELVRASIATYKGNGREVVVFSARYSCHSHALEVVEWLERKMEEGSDFNKPVLLYIDEIIPVNRLDDGDHRHYFFSKESRILWLMIKGKDSNQVLMDMYHYL